MHVSIKVCFCILRKFKKLPGEVYPISYSELCLLFSNTLWDSDLKPCHLSRSGLAGGNVNNVVFLLARFKDVVNLNLNDVEREEACFALHFNKGQLY